MSDPFLLAAAVAGLAVAAVWAARAELRHRRDRVVRTLATVRAVAPLDLPAASDLHGQARRAARRVPARLLDDTDQWLLDVGPLAVLDPAPARPLRVPDRWSERGTTRMPPVRTHSPALLGRGQTVAARGVPPGTAGPPGRGHPRRKV